MPTMSYDVITNFAFDVREGEMAEGEDFGEFDGWGLVRGPVIFDERRWGTVYEIVVKDPDGNFWAGNYTRGNEGPAEDSYKDEDSPLARVYPVEVTRIEYMSISEIEREGLAVKVRA